MQHDEHDDIEPDASGTRDMDLERTREVLAARGVDVARATATSTGGTGPDEAGSDVSESGDRPGGSLTNLHGFRRPVDHHNDGFEWMSAQGARRGMHIAMTVKWQILYVVLTVGVLAASIADVGPLHPQHDPAMLPVISAVTITLSVLIGALLTSDYRAGGNPRMLIIAMAFLWIGFVTFGRLTLMMLEVDILPNGDVASGFGAVVFREVGFTAIAAGAAVRWKQSIYDYVAARENRTRCTVIAISCAALASTFPTIWATIRHDHDARLVDGHDYSALATYAAPVAIPATLLCMAAAIWGYVIKRRGGTVGSWVGTACVVSSIGVLILFESGHAESFGWIAVRFSTMDMTIVLTFVTLLRVRRDQRLADLYRNEASLIELVASNTQSNAAEISRELGQMRDALRHETVVRREVIATVADKIELPVAELQMTLGASLERLQWVRDQQSDGEPRAANAATELEREIARALEAIDTFGATVVAIRTQAENITSTEELISDHQLPSNSRLHVLLQLCVGYVPERTIHYYCDNSIEIRVEAMPFQQVVVGLVKSLPTDCGPIEISAAFDRHDIEVEIRPELDGDLDPYWEPCSVSRALAEKFGWTLECIEHEATYLLRIPALASEYPARIG